MIITVLIAISSFLLGFIFGKLKANSLENQLTMSALSGKTVLIAVDGKGYTLQLIDKILVRKEIEVGKAQDE